MVSIMMTEMGTRPALHALLAAAGFPHGFATTLSYSTVTIGRDYGSWVEVTGGLTPGASVVLNPTDNLQPGQRVRVAP